jgi:hypothetical protein
VGNHRFPHIQNQDSSKLLLFDFKTQKWSDWITEPGLVGYLNWSQD